MAYQPIINGDRYLIFLLQSVTDNFESSFSTNTQYYKADIPYLPISDITNVTPLKTRCTKWNFSKRPAVNNSYATNSIITSVSAFTSMLSRGVKAGNIAITCIVVTSSVHFYRIFIFPFAQRQQNVTSWNTFLTVGSLTFDITKRIISVLRGRKLIVQSNLDIKTTFGQQPKWSL